MESGNEAQEIEEVEEEEEEEEEEGEEAGGQIEDIKILHLMIASVSDDSVGLSFLVSTRHHNQISRARDHDTFHKIMNILSFLLSLFFSFSSLSFLLPSSSFS